jgi:hypothetical protein
MALISDSTPPTFPVGPFDAADLNGSTNNWGSLTNGALQGINSRVMYLLHLDGNTITNGTQTIANVTTLNFPGATITSQATRQVTVTLAGGGGSPVGPTILTGNGVPAVPAPFGAYYLDADTGEAYYNHESWGGIGQLSLFGGTLPWQAGTGIPTIAGVSPDLYLDTITGDSYQHDGTSWTIQRNVTTFSGHRGPLFANRAESPVYTGNSPVIRDGNGGDYMPQNAIAEGGGCVALYDDAIAIGRDNTAGSTGSVVIGGSTNSALGGAYSVYQAIVGGLNNNSNQRHSFIGGGNNNTINSSSNVGGVGIIVSSGITADNGGSFTAASSDSLVDGYRSVLLGGDDCVVGGSGIVTGLRAAAYGTGFVVQGAEAGWATSGQRGLAQIERHPLQCTLTVGGTQTLRQGGGSPVQFTDTYARLLRLYIMMKADTSFCYFIITVATHGGTYITNMVETGSTALTDEASWTAVATVSTPATGLSQLNVALTGSATVETHCVARLEVVQVG